MMRKRFWIKKLFLAMLLLPALLVPAALSAQIYDSLVILPFTGSQPAHAEEIAYSLAEQQLLWNVFAEIYVEEQGDYPAQMDTATIIEYGYALETTHVLTGHIATIEGRNIVLLSILDVYAQQLIAGYYTQYRNFEELNFFEVASQFAGAASLDTSFLPPLFVPFPVLRAGVDRDESALLAQVLSFELARRMVYAIYPMDYDPEMENPAYEGILGFAILNSLKTDGERITFTADIYDMAGVDHLDYAEESYETFTQGLTRMPRLALALTDKMGMEMLLRAEALAAADPDALRRARWEKFWYAGGTKFWSVGINAGTTFNDPLGIANISITGAIWPYTFFELGAEFGMFLTNESETYFVDVFYNNAKYRSMYYFGRFNGYYPLPFGDIGGVYLGVGVGYVTNRYILPNETYGEDYAVVEASSGVFVGTRHNFFRINFGMRTPTDFNSLGYRLTIGHTLRFF